MQTLDWYRIGRRIAGCRVELGWTQVELARRVQCNERSIVKAEAGAHVRMGVPLLVGVSKALGRSLDYLVYGEAPPGRD